MPYSGPIGERIAYAAQGSGPALFLLHGFGSSSATFAANIEALSRRFTVITVDLLGHGASDAPADPALYGVRPSLERLLALVDHLGFERPLLAGHALGGALALRFAYEYPDRVAGVAIVNSTAAVAGDGWREAARPGVAAMASRVRTDGMGWLAESRMNPLRAATLPPAMRARLGLAFQSLTPAAAAATAEGLAVELSAPELLPSLEAPVLLVIGGRDAEFAGHVDGFLARAPDGVVTTAVLPGAGHAAHMDDPAGFASAVIGFAERSGYLVPAVNRVHAGNALVGAGATLVLGGLAMLGAAFLFAPGQDAPAASAPGEDPQRIAGERATATPTSLMSSDRITATASASPTSEDATPSPSVAASPTEEATPADEPTEEPTALPEPTEAPSATEEPVEPTATTVPPTPEPPPPTATTEPAPFAAIEGPSVAQPGVPVLYRNASGGGTILRQQWSFLGTSGDYGPAAIVTFPGPGCYVVSMVTFFSGGETDATSLLVTVGAVSCQ